LSQRTLDSLYANTSIKFAGGVSDKDAYALGRNMRCEPGFIVDQPKGAFAAYVKGVTKNAITLKFPYWDIAKTRRMSATEGQKVHDQLRARYATHYLKVLPSPEPQSISSIEPISTVPAVRAPSTIQSTPAAVEPKSVPTTTPRGDPPKRPKWP